MNCCLVNSNNFLQNIFRNSFDQCSASLQIIEQRSDTEDPIYIQSPPILPAPTSLIQGTITPPVTTTENPWQCHIDPKWQWGDTEDPAYTQSQPNLPAPTSPIQSTITPLVATTRNRWQCYICPKSFSRWQERDRHELTHVPYFIHCPLSHCAWRGNRVDLFEKHWQQEDHLFYHEYYGHTPEWSLIETYDPWAILDQIISGTISLNYGEAQAIFLVQVKAYELQKTSIWTDPWGRSRKQASRCT